MVGLHSLDESSLLSVGANGNTVYAVSAFAVRVAERRMAKVCLEADGVLQQGVTPDSALDP